MRRPVHVLTLSIVLASLSFLSASAQEPAEIQPYSQPQTLRPMTGKQWRVQQAMAIRQQQLNYFTWYRFSPARPTINANPMMQVTPPTRAYVTAPYGWNYNFYHNGFNTY